MEIPAKKFVRLLSLDSSTELRAATALVVAELGIHDAEIAAALQERLTDKNGEVRQQAIRAVGMLKIEKALPTLLEKIAHGGNEASMAAEACAKLGAKGIKGLQELLHKVVPGVRKYITAALTSCGSESVAVSVLLDKDPQIAASAATAIISRIPDLSPADKTALATEMVTISLDKKHPLLAQSEGQVVRILVALNDPVATDVLWDRTVPPHPHEVRAMALQAVGGWTESPTKEQWKRLFLCASESDFQVAAPAMMILNRLPVNDKLLPDYIALFHAPDIAARRLAIDKIGDRDTAQVAEGLMLQLQHADRGVRDTALARLQKLKFGRKSLVAALIAAPNHEDAWPLARTALTFAKDLTPAHWTELFDELCEYLEKHDHRTEPFLFLLREWDHTKLQDGLVEKAVALRKKKKYEAALVYLKAVSKDPSIGFAVRLELAMCGLKVSKKELAARYLESDPCLRNFDALHQNDAVLLLSEIEKAKHLEPEDLLYLGFHFVEQTGRTRQFGTDVLKLLVKRDPKSEAGKSAKNKLKSVGV